MQFEVRPVPKKRRKIRPNLPFPVVNGESDKIKGIFDGKYVIVDDLEAVRQLSLNGCFGKGCSGRPRQFKHSQTRKLKKLRLFHTTLKYSVDESAPDKLNITSEEAPKLTTETSLKKNDSRETYFTEQKMQRQPQTSAENRLDMETETSGSNNSSHTQEMQTISENLPDLMTDPDIEPQTSAENGSLQAPRIIQMDPEEAFFLAHVVNCLEIHYKDNVLKSQDLWSIFKKLKGNFLTNYVAYHYYRSKNWVVKLDTRYGGDLVLYKLGPSLYHSSYVVVIDVLNSNLQRVLQNGDKNLTQLLAINRICESVRKELLICQVICPENMDMSATNFSDISKFSIREVLSKRWISSREREELGESENHDKFYNTAVLSNK